MSVATRDVAISQKVRHPFLTRGSLRVALGPGIIEARPILDSRPSGQGCHEFLFASLNPWRIFCSALAALILSPALFAVEATWIGGASGVWSDPANWSTGVVPGTQDEVLIDSNAGQESTVVLDVNTTLLNLKLDALDTLQVANNKQPTIGALQIAGTVDVGPTSRLVVQNSLWVQPEGRILMNDTPTTVGAWLQLQVAPFWNQGLIEGGGWANAPMFVNEGRVEANLSAQTLEITLGSGANHRNYGDIIASNGGWLSLRAEILFPEIRRF